jgi:hypothetical protein
MAMPTRVQSSSSFTPKTTMPTASGHEFQTHELVICKGKRVVVAYMKEGGEEKGKRKNKLP